MSEEFIEVKNPKKLKTAKLPAERIPVGLPGDYKPCVTLLPNGELLLVAFRYVDLGGGGKFTKNGKFREDVILFRSRDGGKTWSDAEIPENTLGREPYLTVLRDGTLLMTSMLASEIRNSSGSWLSYIHCSHDLGSTWKGLAQGEDMLPPPDQRERFKGNETAGTRNVLELHDGSLLMGLSVYGLRSDAIWRSYDRGETWPEKYPSVIEGLPDDYPVGAFQEAFLWQARSGKLWMIARRIHFSVGIPGKPAPKARDDSFNCMVLYSSTDLGRTWQHIRAIGDYAEHYPAILRLNDKRLLLTYTKRELGPPIGLSAVLGIENEDDFDFDFEHDVLLLENKTPPGVISGGGFGPTVQLSDGTLVSSYSYRVGNNEEDLRLEVVRWQLP